MKDGREFLLGRVDYFSAEGPHTVDEQNPA